MQAEIVYIQFLLLVSSNPGECPVRGVPTLDEQGRVRSTPQKWISTVAADARLSAPSSTRFTRGAV